MPLQKMQSDGTFVPWQSSQANSSTAALTSTIQRSSVAPLGNNAQSHASGARLSAAEIYLLQSLGQQLTISGNAVTYPAASIPPPLPPVAPRPTTTPLQPAPFPVLPPLKKMPRSSTTTQSKTSTKTKTPNKKKKSKTTNATAVADPAAAPAASQSTPALASGVAPRVIANPAPTLVPVAPPAPTLPPPPPKKRGSRKASQTTQPVTGSSSQGSSQMQAPKRPAKPEKRQARFRSHPPQNVLERVHRVLTQRFFMIDRKRETGKLCEEFKVLGSTGNVYTVVIDHLPRCDCPDAGRGNHCKHIMFVFLKVLHVPQNSGHWYQKALLTPELEWVFNNAPIAPNSVSNPRLQAAYAQATGQPSQSSSSIGKGKRKRTDDDDGEAGSGKKRRILTEEDDCPVCYDTMGKTKESDLVWCEGCGNAVHSVCWDQWKTSARSRGNEVTCVYCRAKWASSTATTTAKSGPSQRFEAGRQYLNLAGAAGLGPMQRDTSTYHRHGYGYGWLTISEEDY